MALLSEALLNGALLKVALLKVALLKVALSKVALLKVALLNLYHLDLVVRVVRVVRVAPCPSKTLIIDARPTESQEPRPPHRVSGATPAPPTQERPLLLSPLPRWASGVAPPAGVRRASGVAPRWASGVAPRFAGRIRLRGGG